MAKKIIFSLETPLGYRVVLTRDRWREIIRFKHPALAGREKEVQQCLKDPDLIRASAKDSDVHLYYKGLQRGYVCTVVAGQRDANRIVVTAYFARNIKKGNDLWTK